LCTIETKKSNLSLSFTKAHFRTSVTDRNKPNKIQKSLDKNDPMKWQVKNG